MRAPDAPIGWPQRAPPRSASRPLAASFDADAAARAIIALFHGFVLQPLWEPELDLAACTAVFERFLESLERRHRRVTSKT